MHVTIVQKSMGLNYLFILLFLMSANLSKIILSCFSIASMPTEKGNSGKMTLCYCW